MCLYRKVGGVTSPISRVLWFDEFAADAEVCRQGTHCASSNRESLRFGFSRSQDELYTALPACCFAIVSDNKLQAFFALQFVCTAAVRPALFGNGTCDALVDG